jgi:Flp pilus assembly protein CpaB
MPRRKRLFPVVGALATPLLVAVVAHWAIASPERRMIRDWDLVPIVVASRDIAEGTIISSDMLDQRAIPPKFFLTSFVRSDSVEDVIDQKVQVPLHAGEPLLWSEFVNPDTSIGLHIRDSRGGTVPSSELPGAAGKLLKSR